MKACVKSALVFLTFKVHLRKIRIRTLQTEMHTVAAAAATLALAALVVAAAIAVNALVLGHDLDLVRGHACSAED